MQPFVDWCERRQVLIGVGYHIVWDLFYFVESFAHPKPAWSCQLSGPKHLSTTLVFWTDYFAAFEKGAK